jgi:hypothetical protein
MQACLIVTLYVHCLSCYPLLLTHRPLVYLRPGGDKENYNQFSIALITDFHNGLYIYMITIYVSLCVLKSIYIKIP